VAISHDEALMIRSTTILIAILSLSSAQDRAGTQPSDVVAVENVVRGGTNQRLQASASGRQPASIDGVFERRLLKETHGHGTFVDVHTGPADQPTTIFVHGMPGAASSLTGVIQKAIDAGGTVKAFAYDNKFRSLEDSSGDLASSIETWMDDNPGRRLRVTAHSMGGRLALGALAILERDGRLTGDVELNLMASPIAGMKSAIFSLLAPGFLPWIRPLRGIASVSKFQGIIDRLQLPSNVKVNIFVGGKDDVFTHSTKKYGDLVEKLHATLKVFANATHMSILDEVARLPDVSPASRAHEPGEVEDQDSVSHECQESNLD
jgi:pimeloyl-ACP methyl ester carboxylesterase